MESQSKTTARKRAKPSKKISKLASEKEHKLRLKDEALNQAIFGLIAYFEDTQVRKRSGRHSSFVQSSKSNKTRSRLGVNFKLLGRTRKLTTTSPLRVRNLEGEWISHMHAFPKVAGKDGKTFLTVQDSNLFITGFCSYPLYFFSESELPRHQKHILKMLEASQKRIRSYKRGSAFNFWPKQPPYYGTSSRTGPLNIWIQLAEKMVRVYTHPKLDKKVQEISGQMSVPSNEWAKRCLDTTENPNGADALFNLPNDADDSSMALSLQHMHHEYTGKKKAASSKAAQEILKFRDLKRDKSDGFDQWKGKDTGAFLTWLKDENTPTFKQANQGVIPGGKNNVDIVVNANVLFALSLLGMDKSPGFKNSCELLAKAIDEKQWPYAGLYYPQLMMFPYAVTRAIREGNIQHKTLLKSRTKLLKDILAYQQQDSPELIYFPGDAEAYVPETSHHLSTALGLNALLNLGEEVATQADLLEDYQRCIKGNIAYLLNVAKYKRCEFKSTRKAFLAGRQDKIIATWEDGLFFSSTYWDVCHWRSSAISNACVLEALSKYLMLYDIESKHNHSQPYKRLSIESYALCDLQNGEWLKSH